MEKLDFIEAQVATLVAFRLETMELLNKRAHALIALQLGGGGARAPRAANSCMRPSTRPPGWRPMPRHASRAIHVFEIFSPSKSLVIFT